MDVQVNCGDSQARGASIATRLIELVSTSSGLRYLFTGAGLFFLDLGVYALLHLGFDVAIMTAQLAARSVGAAVGFVAHKFISFGGGDEKQSVSAGSQGVAYTVVMGANILLSPFLVVFLVKLVGGHAILGKLISDAIIITETYLLLRVIFRSDPEPNASAS
jgi:putative flippase GtrA